MELTQAVAEYDYHALSVTPRMELTTEQVTNLVNELVDYHAIYQPHFGNESQGTYSYHYLRGLLDPAIASKSAENIALATVGSEGVRQMQYFVGTSRWSERALIAEHRRQSGLLGRRDGILIVDGSDIPKQGTASVGVKRQWCGQLCKKANCQAGVFFGYSSRAGYTLLDKRLYLPADWFTAEYAEKRYKCHVPADLTFQTKNELAWSMIAACAEADTLAARWLTMDEAFGKDSQLLERIDGETDYYYFAEVPKDTQLWLTEPETYIPESSGRGRPATKRTHSTGCANGRGNCDAVSNGCLANACAAPRHERLSHCQVAAIRVYPARVGLPGKQGWLVLRRNPDDPTEIHYFLSNAPADTPFDELLYVCAMRWPRPGDTRIIFEQAKQLLGLNEYETRTWPGWHHHMTHVILAFGFLTRTQAIFRMDAPALTLPQVVDLLKAVLPKPEFDAEAAIELLRYKQAQIASAKKSHFNMQKSKIIQQIRVTQ